MLEEWRGRPRAASAGSGSPWTLRAPSHSWPEGGSEPVKGQRGVRCSPGRDREPCASSQLPEPPEMGSFFQLPFPTEYLVYGLFLYLGIYGSCGNGFHSTSSMPIFLIIVVQALREFLNKSGYFSFRNKLSCKLMTYSGCGCSPETNGGRGGETPGGGGGDPYRLNRAVWGSL